MQNLVTQTHTHILRVYVINETLPTMLFLKYLFCNNIAKNS